MGRRDSVVGGIDVMAERDVATIGAVSFLNTRPLVHGLEGRDDLRVEFGVPSVLAEWLAHRRVDAALVPVVDLGNHWDEWEAISDACIASDGPTLTVQVFSRRPIHEIRRLHADRDSHTSVVLARIVLGELCGGAPDIAALDPVAHDPDDFEAVLLIGDKVATTDMDAFPHRLDLGAAWKQMTGLPFVFAVWAAHREAHLKWLGAELSAARDAGLAAVDEIVSLHAPARGWSTDLAYRYLTRHIKFRLDDRARAGLREFLDRAARDGFIHRVGRTKGA